MIRHTPEWKLADVRGTYRLVTPTGNAVLELKLTSAEGAIAYDANARLIEAAPKLLASLRACLEILDYMHRDGSFEEYQDVCENPDNCGHCHASIPARKLLASLDAA